MCKYSIVIPAFNEEENIHTVYTRIKEVMDNLKESWELIFVNDGSRDNTQQVLDTLAGKDKRVKFLELSRNFGHQAALTAGLNYSTGQAIISMDCDLQDPPELVVQMIEKWKLGNDVVYARRLNFRKDNLFKRWGSQMYYKILSKFSSVEIPRNVGDFRLVDRKVLDVVNQLPETSKYLRGLVAWTGFSYDFVDYERADRELGTSEYSLIKLMQLGMSGLFSFSFLPLKLGFLLGSVSIFFGFGFLFYMFWDIIANDVYYHLYKFLVVVLFIFMGFFFILLWLLGEYIGRIYKEVQQRPEYLVKSKKNIGVETS